MDLDSELDLYAAGYGMGRGEPICTPVPGMAFCRLVLSLKARQCPPHPEQACRINLPHLTTKCAAVKPISSTQPGHRIGRLAYALASRAGSTRKGRALHGDCDDAFGIGLKRCSSVNMG